MVVAASLRFLLCTTDELAPEQFTDTDLESLQSPGVSRGFGLRITVTHDLGGGFQRVCDAITPQLCTDQLWLASYAPCQSHAKQWQQIDHFPLREARNESCWFYPTHDGHYLSWRRELELRLGVGRIASADSGLQSEEESQAFDRDHIALLWSLLGDDSHLTCVGLTYGGRRIDWPLQTSQWAASATWCNFSVDSNRDPSLVVHERQDVPAPLLSASQV